MKNVVFSYFCSKHILWVHVRTASMGSNEYPQSMFKSKNKKNNAYPCSRQFYYIKVGCHRGIKHDFPFINICKVPREVLKTEGDARGFQPSRGTLRMLMNDKIMFDRYYCINSANHCENEENITFSYASTLLKTMHNSGPVQILIILHVLCVSPGNKHN